MKKWRLSTSVFWQNGDWKAESLSQSTVNGKVHFPMSDHCKVNRKREDMPDGLLLRHFSWWEMVPSAKCDPRCTVRFVPRKGRVLHGFQVRVSPLAPQGAVWKECDRHCVGDRQTDRHITQVNDLMSSVRIVGWMTGVRFPAGQGFSSSPPRLDRLWGPLSLSSNGYRHKTTTLWSWPLTSI
jgi:hypothetical protein